MYRVGDLREVVTLNSAGTGSSDAVSTLSNRVFTCVCSLWLFTAHTWMLSSSRVVRIPSRVSTKSERGRQTEDSSLNSHFEAG